MWSRTRSVSENLGKKKSTYIFNEVAFRITSLGIAANGVRDAFGGVFKKGGGNPGGKPAGVGVKVAGGVGVGVDGSIPAARNLSRRDMGATGAPLEAGGGW